MGDALDLRDAETGGHPKRVTAYSLLRMARALGVDAAAMKIIARGAFLHDIGKIATPDAILLKPGKLTPAEVTVMREHCQRGYEIVRKIPFLLEAAEIVHSHQEKFDGTGYPRGLQGHEIPLWVREYSTRLPTPWTRLHPTGHIAKVRVFNMCPGRRLSAARALQFDPEIVTAFLVHCREVCGATFERRWERILTAWRYCKVRRPRPGHLNTWRRG